ncbi:MAG: hypothetical protein PHC30_09730, partial [Lentisphaeria bacterium]|nr:hypothetical protein [Lentisphaeria bacterium]
MFALALLVQAAVLAGEATITSKLLPEPATAAWRLEELSSPVNAPETYRVVDPAAEQLQMVTVPANPLASPAQEYRFSITNTSGRPRLLRPVVELATPFTNAKVWKGYLDPGETQFDPGDKILSTWFPANAAIDGDKALVLAINPMDLYSRLDVWHQVADNNQTRLLLGYPVYLEDQAAFTFSFVVTAIEAPCGYRDAIQAMYDLFPKAFQPHPDTSPDLIS